jgi:hypothetical protein
MDKLRNTLQALDRDGADFEESRWRRLLPGVLRLRDVEDVERHAAGHLGGLSMPEAQRRAVIIAVADAYRVDRALPPEKPLRPVLDSVLESRAARLALEESHGALAPRTA